MKHQKHTIFDNIQQMRLIIFSKSYFHLIIIQKDVMSVRWNLKIVG